MSARGRLSLLLLATPLTYASAALAQEGSPETVPLPPAEAVAGPQEQITLPSEPATELPGPAPTSEDATSDELSAEELARLGFGGGESSSAVDTSIKLSGFMDFKFVSMLGPKDSFWRTLQSHSSMFIGNLNVYLSKNFTESVRTFAEVRFTYLPNGEPISSTVPGAYRSTATVDYADAERQLRWGGVILERAYLEWTLHPSAALRIGQYLTPYGIWNVDHGSPTIITSQRPFVVGQQLFPERQTGLQLLGSVRASDYNRFGYSLTMSNGMGPVSEYRDLDENKAVGGRVDWTYDAFGELRIGGSLLYGRDTAARRYVVPQADGSLRTGETVDVQSDVLALGADLRWTYRSLLLQAEFISQQRRYTDAGRTGGNVLANGNQYLAPRDALALGAYGLIGYRFSWLGVMPYFLYTYNDLYSPVSFTSINNHAMQAGLNIRPLDAIVFKVEYIGIKLIGSHKPTDDMGHSVQGQLAWAF